MPHLFAPASSGRSKCRGCGQPIARGALRFGECLPNLFGDGEMTLWFHPLCAAYKRPQSVLDALKEATESVPDREKLEHAALGSAQHRRVPRINGAERAPGGQARCRCCHEPIPRDSWRIRIEFYEEGRFSPGGYLHLTCRKVYFETDEISSDHILHFSPTLSETEREDLIRALETPSP
jgi:Poly(ADP-ribose) polymerase and DNA-Ligase Zn-finger region